MADVDDNPDELAKLRDLLDEATSSGTEEEQAIKLQSILKKFNDTLSHLADPEKLKELTESVAAVKRGAHVGMTGWLWFLAGFIPIGLIAFFAYRLFQSLKEKEKKKEEKKKLKEMKKKK